MRPATGPKRSFLMVIAFASAITLVSAACGSQDTNQKSKLQQVLERGKVIVGVTAEFAPLGFTDANGNLVGFDIDIARLVAKSLFGDETKIELRRTAFEARWASVKSGEIDVGIMGTTIFPDRLLQVAFTDIYLDSGIAVVVRTNTGVDNIGDLNSSEYTIARLPQPPEDAIMAKYFPTAKSLALSSQSDVFTALEGGRADALLTGLAPANYYAAHHDSFKVLKELVSDPTRYGFFMAQGDFEWWLYLNQLVTEMRSGTLYTEYSAIYENWFGRPPPPQNWYIDKAGS